VRATLASAPRPRPDASCRSPCHMHVPRIRVGIKRRGSGGRAPGCSITSSDQTGTKCRVECGPAQQVRPDPPILVRPVIGTQGLRRAPHVLRHVNEIHHDRHRDVSLFGQLLEPLELGEIPVDQGDSPFLTSRIAVRRLVKHRRDHLLR
jgi:hypothetical protein